MLKRSEKEEIVKKLSENLKEAKSVVFSNYQGLSVNELKELRDELRKNEISYTVIKKTLIQIAMKNQGIEGDVKSFEGPIGVSISKEDEIAAAKTINEFAKKNKHLQISGGILENKLLDKETVENLAKLSSKEELIAKVVGTINGPLVGFVGVLNGVLRSFVQVLNAIGERKE